MVSFTVIPLAVVAIGTIGLWSSISFFTPAPEAFPSTKDKESLLSPLGLICHAHTLISELQRLTPETPTTLLSILHLDHTKPPFFPVDDCTAPYSTNYHAARLAVADAWAESIDERDGDMREWRDLYSVAAVVLLNDTMRTLYLKEVLPKVLKDGEKAWKDKCKHV
ncbi:hypothetical protein ACHAQK_009281 [Fusarium lateritium]